MASCESSAREHYIPPYVSLKERRGFQEIDSTIDALYRREPIQEVTVFQTSINKGKNLAKNMLQRIQRK